MKTSCIETTRSRDRHGYGKCEVKRFGRMIRSAHVLAWVDAHGQLPPSEAPYILHHCDNRPCINPEHLYAGTHADNMRDMTERGRAARSERGLWTHCKNGHEFTSENTYIRPDGNRTCRTCQRSLVAAYKARKKASA